MAILDKGPSFSERGLPIRQWGEELPDRRYPQSSFPKPSNSRPAYGSPEWNETYGSMGGVRPAPTQEVRGRFNPQPVQPARDYSLLETAMRMRAGGQPYGQTAPPIQQPLPQQLQPYPQRPLLKLPSKEELIARQRANPPTGGIPYTRWIGMSPYQQSMFRFNPATGLYDYIGFGWFRR